LVNIYDSLGFDPSDPTETIRDGLAKRKARFATRRQREDAAGIEARRMYDLIEQVEGCFTSDAARMEYDRSLRATPAAAEPTGPNWLSLAWSYYAQEEFGPAEVAARKAREADRENPDAWVVSAWIELAPVTRHPLLSAEDRRAILRRERALAELAETAKKYADEAYTPFGTEAAADVAHVRGVCFYLLEDYDRAAQSFRAALASIDNPEERAELNLRLALSLTSVEENKGALEACEQGLATSDGVPEQLISSIERIWACSTISVSEAVTVDQRADAYAKHASHIRTAPIDPDCASRLAAVCDANAKRVETYAASMQEWHRQVLARLEVVRMHLKQSFPGLDLNSGKDVDAELKKRAWMAKQPWYEHLSYKARAAAQEYNRALRAFKDQLDYLENAAARRRSHLAMEPAPPAYPAPIALER
jgi:tetratricopeptide (TPR) repeat protein